MQVVQLTRVEKYPSRNHVILHFQAGARCVDLLTNLLHTSRQLNILLGCAHPEHALRVDNKMTELRQRTKTLGVYVKEVATLHGNELAATYGKAASGSVVCVHRDGYGAGIDFLIPLADAVLSTAPHLVLFATDEESGQFLLAGEEKRISRGGDAGEHGIGVHVHGFNGVGHGATPAHLLATAEIGGDGLPCGGLIEV